MQLNKKNYCPNTVSAFCSFFKLEKRTFMGNIKYPTEITFKQFMV